MSSITGLGTKGTGRRAPVLGLLSFLMLIGALVALAFQLSRFAQNRDLLQTDITIGQIPVTGMRLQEAIGVLENTYMQPVELEYNGYPILLSPADINFHVNNDQIRSEVQAKLAGTNSYWADFWNYLWQRPSAPVEVALNATYSQADLRSYLDDVAKRFDRGALSAQFDVNSMAFGEGSGGQRLDIDQAMPLIEKVLFSPQNRKVVLPMKSENAIALNMNSLKQAILDFLKTKGIANDGASTLASIGVIDLETGQELWINPDVAYSAMSTIKIPIMLNIFGEITYSIADDIKWLMGASILCSSNSASNYLMQTAGRGDLRAGLSQINGKMQGLGAKNTYISAPLYVGETSLQFSIGQPETHPNPNYSANPDPYSQTTAEDMGILLQELYDCAEYNSGLAAIMPGKYTQAECKQMLELMSGNVIGRLIELGVPVGTRVAHKNGWGGTAAGGANVSDAAIVYSPNKTYVLVVYMWERQANIDGIGTLVPWEGIEGISRIVYNYFNPAQPLSVGRVPENALGAIDCVMPNPAHIERLSLENINNGRFNEDGTLVADACYGYPTCIQHLSDVQAPLPPTPTPSP